MQTPQEVTLVFGFDGTLTRLKRQDVYDKYIFPNGEDDQPHFKCATNSLCKDLLLPGAIDFLRAAIQLPHVKVIINSQNYEQFIRPLLTSERNTHGHLTEKELASITILTPASNPNDSNTLFSSSKIDRYKSTGKSLATTTYIFESDQFAAQKYQMIGSMQDDSIKIHHKNHGRFDWRELYSTILKPLGAPPLENQTEEDHDPEEEQQINEALSTINSMLLKAYNGITNYLSRRVVHTNQRLANKADRRNEQQRQHPILFSSSHRKVARVVNDDTPTRSQGKTRAQIFKRLLFDNRLTHIQRLVILYALLENTKGPTLNSDVVAAFNDEDNAPDRDTLITQVRNSITNFLMNEHHFTQKVAASQLDYIQKKIVEPFNRHINYLRQEPPEKFFNDLQNTLPEPLENPFEQGHP